MKPYAAVQALLQCKKDGTPKCIAGSCFRLWSDNHYITAAHCVSNIAPDELRVMNCLCSTGDLQCIKIMAHPQADIAVLKVTGQIPKSFEKFELYDKDFYCGQQIHCFGMVCNSDGSFVDATQRVIGGITQRDFIHADGAYESKAIELSVPIPIGMSGGPAFVACKPGVAMGVGIASIKSEVVVSGFEEYENGTLQQREKISEIIRYGVVLRLHTVRDWLHEKMNS